MRPLVRLQVFKMLLNQKLLLIKYSRQLSEIFSLPTGFKIPQELFVLNVRACSYDPAYRDVSLTDDLASYLFSYKILHCVHMRKRAGPLAEISFEFAEII